MAAHADTSRQPFLFATGIENSCPVVVDANGKPHRRDQMAETGHYDRWREDFALVKAIGLRYVRFGPAYYRTHIGRGRYDWTFADDAFDELRRLQIIPIVDLCHFGVPDWIGSFQNPEFPALFAEYADAFARRYPWLRFYTPINEIFVAAHFSAKLGWWNERLRSDHGFVTAIKHMARATILAEQAMLAVRPDAIFIQSESSEYFHARDLDAQPKAAFLNEIRFLSLDLCYGHEVSGTIYDYLLANGFSAQEYRWFLHEGAKVRSSCVMGNDYYDTNEHLVTAHGEDLEASGEILGYFVITHEYFRRYQLPVMHTETNHRGADDGVFWLWKQWVNMLRLKKEAVPIVGFTWYSLIDQMDWDTAMRNLRGRTTEVGLYRLDRTLRPVGKAFGELVAQWRDIMPVESRCLMEM